METVIRCRKSQVRQRQAHHKSRLGCGNCKIRRIKCDETKPECKRCVASTYSCNYSDDIPALQLACSGAFKVNLGNTNRSVYKKSTSTWRLQPSTTQYRTWMFQPCIPIVLPVSGQLGEYELRPIDHATLHRFQNRTIETFGHPSVRSWYGQAVLKLGALHPFLIHLFIAITTIHEAHISHTTVDTCSQRSALAFHLYHGTAIFKQMLAQPSPVTTLTSSERDSLWVSAALLGSACFGQVKTLDPNAAWPLTESGPTDLDWIKMSSGKQAVWDIAQPIRPESMMHRTSKIHTSLCHLDSTIRPHTLPALFYSVFGLTSNSMEEGNPYFTPVCMISQLWHEPMSEHNLLRYLSFITHINMYYLALIEEKDPRALLLLVYWHSMVAIGSTWWLYMRSVVQGKAICMYIEKHCADDPDILQLCQLPRKHLELAGLRQGL